MTVSPHLLQFREMSITLVEWSKERSRSKRHTESFKVEFSSRRIPFCFFFSSTPPYLFPDLREACLSIPSVSPTLSKFTCDAEMNRAFILRGCLRVLFPLSGDLSGGLAETFLQEEATDEEDKEGGGRTTSENGQKISFAESQKRVEDRNR